MYCVLFYLFPGMIFMAITRSATGVIVFSWTAGIMYSTLFTMPYLLVANYHANQVVSPFYQLGTFSSASNA